MVQDRLSAIKLVATSVLTPTKVDELDGKIRTIHRSQFNARADVKSTHDGKFNRVKMAVSSVDYNCEQNALEASVTRALRRQYASEIDFVTAQAYQVARSVLIEREVRTAAILNNTTTLPLSGNTGLDVSTAWTSAAADIIGDIKYGKNKRINQGVKLTHLVVNGPTWNELWANNAIRSSFVYTTPAGAPSPDDQAAHRLMASTLGLEGIIVGDGVYSADHDEASPAMTNIWSSVYAALITPCPADPSEPGFGRMPYWETEGGDGAGLGVSEYYSENQSRGEVTRFVENVDEIVISSDHAFLLKID